MSLNNISKLKFIYFFKSLNFFAPILALFYLARGLSTFQLLSLEVILTITLFLAEIPTGIIADKIKRKYSVTLVILLYLIGNILTIYSQTYILFVVVQVIFGIALAFGSGAIEALVYDSLKSEKKEKEMNKHWGAINSQFLFAGMISALIGGWLTQSQNMDSFILAFWLYSIGAFIALIASFSIKEPKHYKKIEHDNPIIIFKKALKSIITNSNLRKIILVSVLTVPFPHILKMLFQPYFNISGVQPILFGVAVSVAMLGGALLSRNAYKIENKFGINKTIFIMNLLPAIIYIIMSLTTTGITSFIFYVVIVSLAQMRNPLFSQYQNDHIESKNRATALSIISMFHAIYFIVSQLIIGKIADYNLLYSFMFMGIIILANTLLFRVNNKHFQ